MTEPQPVTMVDVRQWAADAAAAPEAFLSMDAVRDLCAEIERLNGELARLAHDMDFALSVTEEDLRASMTPEDSNVDATETAG